MGPLPMELEMRVKVANYTRNCSVRNITSIVYRHLDGAWCCMSVMPLDFGRCVTWDSDEIREEILAWSSKRAYNVEVGYFVETSPLLPNMCLPCLRCAMLGSGLDGMEQRGDGGERSARLLWRGSRVQYPTYHLRVACGRPVSPINFQVVWRGLEVLFSCC